MQTNYELQRLNTLALPAKAKVFARFASQMELLGLLDKAKENNISVYVLGEGSNVLLANDIDGLVLQSAMEGVKLLEQDDAHIWVVVEAGKNWHQWVQESIEYGHGLENLALIPGSVGAAPIQNIGAYGVEVKSFIEQIEGVQISTGQAVILTAEECNFGYRDSIFKHELKNDFIITRVTFRLNKIFNPVLSYGPLQQLQNVNASSLIQAVCDTRRSKLPDPKSIPNAGSFFKNPIISAKQASELVRLHPELPHYQQKDGMVKVAAGWLIEQAGWKGKWLGNVRMHEKQALVLTTNGQASYQEVVDLKDKIITNIKERFGVTLEPEPQVFP